MPKNFYERALSKSGHITINRKAERLEKIKEGFILFGFLVFLFTGIYLIVWAIT